MKVVTKVKQISPKASLKSEIICTPQGSFFTLSNPLVSSFEIKDIVELSKTECLRNFSFQIDWDINLMFLVFVDSILVKITTQPRIRSVWQ